jgi:hypothetical protein
MHLIRCWLVGVFTLALLMLTYSVGRTDARTRLQPKMLEVLICVGEEYPAGCGPRKSRPTWGNAGAQDAGTVSGPRIMCGGRSKGRLNTLCSADFPDDRKVALKVEQAGSGRYVFHHWVAQGQEKCRGRDKTCTVRVQVGRTVRVRAVFTYY